LSDVKVDPVNNTKKMSKTKPITLTFSKAFKLVGNQVILKNISFKIISKTKTLNEKFLLPTILHRPKLTTQSSYPGKCNRSNWKQDTCIQLQIHCWWM